MEILDERARDQSKALTKIERPYGSERMAWPSA
jgi:hypothetical protein